MKNQFYLVLLSSITILSCIQLGGDFCEGDVTIETFNLSDLAKSFLPSTILDSLTYTNGQNELTLYNNQKKELSRYQIAVHNICSTNSAEAWEWIDVQEQIVNYFHANGNLALSFAVRHEATPKGFTISYDSVTVFEHIGALIYKNDESNNWKTKFICHVNNVKNEISASSSFISTIIQDTIINGELYNQVLSNESYPDIFYTKEEGIISYKCDGETWYLKK